MKRERAATFQGGAHPACMLGGVATCACRRPLYGSETLLPPSAKDGRGAARRVESARDLQKFRKG